MVSTQDFESCDPGSSPGRTFIFATKEVLINHKLKLLIMSKYSEKLLVCYRLEVQKITHVRFLPDLFSFVPGWEPSSSSG